MSARNSRRSKKTGWSWSEVSVDICTHIVTLTTSRSAHAMHKALASVGINFRPVNQHSVRLASEEDLNMLLLLVPGGRRLEHIRNRCRLLESTQSPSTEKKHSTSSASSRAQATSAPSRAAAPPAAPPPVSDELVALLTMLNSWKHVFDTAQRDLGSP